MFNILLVEDENDLRTLYSKVLIRNGYRVVEASNGEEALDILDRNQADLIVTDIMMPRMDGYEFIASVREAGYIMPVLMITAKDKFTDLQLGFLSGTDDYMIKPININEMVIRIQALLRRAQMVSARKYIIGNTTLDYDSLSVISDGKTHILPQKEFQLLYKLSSNMNQSFTKIQLMDEIWGVDSYSDPHTIEVHINRLRERLIDNKDIEIITIRGIGYKAVKKNDKGI